MFVWRDVGLLAMVRGTQCACYTMCAAQYVLRNVLVLLYIIIELFGIQSHGFLSVVLVLLVLVVVVVDSRRVLRFFFSVVFRFVFRARVRCCCLLGLVCGFRGFLGAF